MCIRDRFFIGMIGEYVGAIHAQVLRRPPVIEKERINFAESGSEHATPEIETAGINGGVLRHLRDVYKRQVRY